MIGPDDGPLPSWRPGATRSRLLAFLEDCGELPPEERIAVFDNDGTLWCERPDYPQLAFFVHELSVAVADRPALADRVEYRALLDQDHATLTELGLPTLGAALLELFSGMDRATFAERARRFLFECHHPVLARPYAACTYQPMQELLDALRARGFRLVVSTGGGAEFVCSASVALYGIEPDDVLGTALAHDGDQRTAGLDGPVNEGPAKVDLLARHLGRTPCFAAGNSAGDRELLDWALTTDGPSLALLVDHDDAEREFAYESVGGTVSVDEPIVELAWRSGWTVAVMSTDWATIFPQA